MAANKAACVGKVKVRRALNDKLLSLGPGALDAVSASEAMRLMGEGVQKLDDYLGKYLPQLFFAVIAPLALFACVARESVPCAVVLLVCVPLIPATIVAIMKIAKRAMGLTGIPTSIWEKRSSRR